MNASKIKTLVDKNAFNGVLKSDDLVQIIELCNDYLDLKTISQFAKENNMSYNGVKKHRRLIKLPFGKFVIE